MIAEAAAYWIRYARAITALVGLAREAIRRVTWPDGQITDLAVQSRLQKYSASRFTQIKSISRASRSL
jgi:hypothetical protein